jgi:anti-sigma regulatory factor (Ser/Thr protein kinase)
VEHDEPQRRLTLRAELSELPRVVAWLDDLEGYYHVPPATRYAMDLCLEEAISNIIRHGYREAGGGPIVVRHRAGGDGQLLLIVDDEGPPFDPLAVETLPEVLRDEWTVGGLGIGLMRRFATSITYERHSTGNRLTFGFSWTSPPPI